MPRSSSRDSVIPHRLVHNDQAKASAIRDPESRIADPRPILTDARDRHTAVAGEFFLPLQGVFAIPPSNGTIGPTSTRLAKKETLRPTKRTAAINKQMAKQHNPTIQLLQGRFAQHLAICAVAALTGISGCSRSEAEDAAAESKRFTEVTTQAGFTHTHHKPILDHKLDNIMAWVCSVGAAAAAADFDKDGWQDLYVTDSRKGFANFLYRNNGDGTFIDVAARAGVANLNGDQGTSMDCIWGDYNNDGWPDLYVVRWGTDALFKNNGDGTFTDSTSKCFAKRDGSPGTDWANGNAALFFDHNLDGRLDIYVGNYFDDVDLWHLDSTRIMHNDFEKARNGGSNFLYTQQPDGTFVEASASFDVDDPGWTLAVGSADINNDGWPDLYCADDFGPDQLFVSNRKGGFTNVSDSAIGFDTKKGMNVDFGDFNNDGWLDIYVANITTAEYLQEGNMLWYNNGSDQAGAISFTDIALETGTYDGGWGWGAKFFDHDNDGDLDILAVNGFISAGEGNYWYDLASWTVLGEDSADAANWPAIGTRSFSGHERFRFWRNDGMNSFSQRAAEVGLDSNQDGRGLVCFDYDNDGDLDIFVANHDQAPHLYRNDAPTNSSHNQHWLMVQLETDSAAKVNRDGIGTRVTLVNKTGRQIRERDGGNGYCGQSDPRLHFGLGGEQRVDLVEIRWPDGGLQYLENIKADQIVVVRQDPAIYATKVAIFTEAPRPWKRSESASTIPPPPAIDPEALDGLLVDMEQRLGQFPDGYTLGSVYRQQCAEHSLHERAVDFLKQLHEQRPGHIPTRMALACSYVDKIPTCGGIAAVVSKGTLARKSLNHLDDIVNKENGLWVAYYCRAMNHLHWPRALRHSDDAAVDFSKCIQLQKEYGSPNARPYFVRSHIGLGDACAKNKEYKEARAAWRAGLKAFPESGQLKKRLALKGDRALLDYVEEVRNLESPVDTDLSFLDRSP